MWAHQLKKITGSSPSRTAGTSIRQAFSDPKFGVGKQAIGASVTGAASRSKVPAKKTVFDDLPDQE
jgi:hypothetical protein